MIEPLFRELQSFEKSIRPQRKPVSETGGAFRYVQKNILEHSGAAFVACIDGAPIGFIAGWVTESDGLDQGHHRVGLVSDAFVLKPYRRQGVFTALTAAMAAHFTAQGLDRMALETLGRNAQMQAVLDRSGFSTHKILYEKPLGTGV